jgi:hypothetical protein
LNKELDDEDERKGGIEVNNCEDDDDEDEEEEDDEEEDEDVDGGGMLPIILSRSSLNSISKVVAMRSFKARGSKIHLHLYMLAEIVHEIPAESVSILEDGSPPEPEHSL